MKNSMPTLIIKISAFALILSYLVSCGGSGQSNPTGESAPLAYVKRPVPTDQNDNPISNDYRDPSSFNPGANIFLKTDTSFSAGESNITSGLLGTTGDVKDLEFSSDGMKLVFSMQLEDPNPNDDIPMTWDIYTYDIASGMLAPVIASAAIRRQGHDVMPHFVPDGNDPAARIVFSSDRGEGLSSILNSEGKPNFKVQTDDRSTYAFNLHMIDVDDPTTLRQITYNMSHDFDPVMLADGRIMFVRLDDSRSGVGFNSNNRYSLYTVHPDGTNIERLYGFDSQTTGTANSRAVFTSPRLLSDGRVVAILRDFTNTFDGGDVITIDVNNYIDNMIPVNAGSGLTGPAQSTATATTNAGVVLTNAGLSVGGKYSAAAPMQDGSNRAIVSYSLCFAEVTNPDTTVDTVSCGLVPDLSDPSVAVAPPRYGIYIQNLSSGTASLIRNAEAGFYYTDIAISLDLPSPTVIPNATTGATQQAGVLNIRSVYELDGAFNDLGGPAATDFTDLMDNSAPEARRPRFIRITKGVFFPDNDDFDNFDFDTAGFGTGVNFMREIIGYAPIHPDGSVRVQVPANVPLSFDVVDVNVQRINIPSAGQEYSHPTWIVVRPDEEKKCHGCHVPTSTRSHGRSDASITPMPGPGAMATGFGYPGIVEIPVAAGDTMAEARTLVSTLSLPVSRDVVYDDVWVNSGNSFTRSYLAMQTVINSVNANPSVACGGSFTPECRIVYDYVKHIQPLWEVARTDINAVDKTCVTCHSPFNAVRDDPQGLYQLDLTTDHGGGVDTLRNQNFLASYNELFLNDDVVEGMGTVLVDTQFVTDCNGAPMVAGPRTVFCDGVRIMNEGFARNSNVFFNEFTMTNNEHCPADGNGGCASILTADELRAISEWIDNGGQYVNNPFDSPQ